MLIEMEYLRGDTLKTVFERRVNKLKKGSRYNSPLKRPCVTTESDYSFDQSDADDDEDDAF